MTASPSGQPGTLAGLSSELAATVELVGRSVVAVNARRRIPSSGVVWQPGVVVAASHTIARDDDITVTLASGRSMSATPIFRSVASSWPSAVPDRTSPPASGS